jgi:hypothetical protein
MLADVTLLYLSEVNITEPRNCKLQITAAARQYFQSDKPTTSVTDSPVELLAGKSGPSGTFGLFVSQGVHRVEPGCAQGQKIAGCQSYGGQASAGENKRESIVGLQAKQHGRGRTAHG